MPYNLTPTIYRDANIDKFVKYFMRNGDYQKAQGIVYFALEQVKRERYMEYVKLPPEEQKNFMYNPFDVANAALKNMEPIMKLANHVRGKKKWAFVSSSIEFDQFFKAQAWL